MPLEVEGTSASAGCHWERLAIYDEVLTASGLIDARYTELNFALLKDSGWYIPVYKVTDMDPIYWGQGMGCGWLNNTCTYEDPGREFCTGSGNGCSFDYTKKGICASYSFTENCNI